MNEFVQWLRPVAGLMFFLSIFGNSLLFWPIYTIFHRQKTRRRRALFLTFMVALCLYVALTGLVVWGFYAIEDFHHALLFVYGAYILLDIGCWVASLAVL